MTSQQITASTDYLVADTLREDILAWETAGSPESLSLWLARAGYRKAPPPQSAGVVAPTQNPAVAAGKRACMIPSMQEAATMGASEALKAIRQRHTPIAVYQVGRVCSHDGHRWPCADALDSYPAAELGL